jgi:hypothetical protein
MDQFRFVGRIPRSNANTRLSGRASRLFTLFRSSSVTCGLAAVSVLWVADPAFADERGRSDKKWVATWTTAPQDVFSGSSAPALVNFAFPNPTTDGANNQTLRMIVKPDL